MTDFTDANLTGATFRNVSLAGAEFRHVTFAGATFRGVDLSGISIRTADLIDVEINGEVENLRVNGVDVVPFVEAELDRRHPERALMRPVDADGFRTAWDTVERLWAGTVDRARGLPPELLHEHVDGEWSFIENLRHLVFATDAWVRRTVLGEPEPWHPLGLPHDEMPDTPPLPRDRAARPSLDEVLALRADRMATVRAVVGDLTDEALDAMTQPAEGPGYPEPGNVVPVRDALRVILNEEWMHRLYVERDLDTLVAREA